MSYEKDDFETMPEDSRAGDGRAVHSWTGKIFGRFYGGEMMWDDFVKNASSGYDWPSYTAEGIMKNYHHTRKRLADLEERFKKTPVTTKGGRPLLPATIRQLEREKESLIQSVACYQKFIKVLVKKNMLPTSKLISGEDRMQFVFSLWTMLELPELGKAVYYANRLTGCRYDHTTPATKNGFDAQTMTGGYRRSPGKKEQDREGMYGALIDSLGEAIERIKKERQRLLFSGIPWQPPKNTSERDGTKVEKETSLCGIDLSEERLKRLGERLKTESIEAPQKEKPGSAQIISKEFLAFQREQRMKTEQHPNA